MISVYRSRLAKSFEIVYQDALGSAVSPVSASYTLRDEDGADIVTDVAIDVSGAPVSALIEITGEQNTQPVDQTRGFRKLILSFADSMSNEYEQSVTYIIEDADTLVYGENSLATYPKLMMTLPDMLELSAAQAASETDLTRALINAYYNIGNLRMEFDAEGEESVDLSEIRTTMDLTTVELDAISAGLASKLIRASLIEANAVLGGNPVEDRRRMGLMSDSTGESAHFFRPSKPVELPVSKETARALSPMVRYVVKIGR